MDEDEPESYPDWYTRQKIGTLLFAEEVRQETHNGWFTWAWVIGLLGFIWGVVSAWGNASAGRSDFVPLFNIPVGILLFALGIALRINGGIALAHIRRLQKQVNLGRYPE